CCRRGRLRHARHGAAEGIRVHTGRASTLGEGSLPLLAALYERALRVRGAGGIQVEVPSGGMGEHLSRRRSTHHPAYASFDTSCVCPCAARALPAGDTGSYDPPLVRGGGATGMAQDGDLPCRYPSSLG